MHETSVMDCKVHSPEFAVATRRARTGIRLKVDLTSIPKDIQPGRPPSRLHARFAANLAGESNGMSYKITPSQEESPTFQDTCE